MENIDVLKEQSFKSGELRYRLKNANVFVSPSGYHYIDYLDPLEVSLEINESKLTKEEYSYIELSLQSNVKRFEDQKQTIKKYLPLEKLNILDIGCGGGLFLSKLKLDGANVLGIELSDSRAQYAKTIHSIEVHKRPVEDGFWQDNYANHFDVATLWDVIEHVNFPYRTLLSASRLLREGGLLVVDTPCRDSFYHRIGALTYRLTRGLFPTFLNVMYSAHLFGHKQIFSTSEMKRLFDEVGLEVVELKKFHELSFPYEHYLKKLIGSDVLVRLFLPLVNLLFYVFKIQNKMLVVGRKK